MILCLDIGNSQIYGGVFENETLLLKFRRRSKGGTSSDELGLFLRSVLRENDIDPKSIESISICTVVPEALHSTVNCCLKYFSTQPFVLQAGVKTGLSIRYKNPAETGSDRIANAVAATSLYPNKNLVIVDFGTATTLCAVNSRAEYLGGSILSGLKMCVESLESKTAKLPSVEIIQIESALGRTTIESIQSGLYYGHLGAIKELVKKIAQECGFEKDFDVIGTGGFVGLFKEENIFDYEVPDLVLQGLRMAFLLNQPYKEKNKQGTTLRSLSTT